MRYATKLLAAGTFLAAVSPASAIDVTPSISGDPANFGFNQVYGRITFDSKLIEHQKVSPQLPGIFVALATAVRRLFNRQTANYNLTVSVQKGTQNLAQRAVYRFSYDNGARQTTKFSAVNGTLLGGFPVTSANNELQVSLQVQKADSDFLAVDTFNKLAAQLSVLSIPIVNTAIKLAPSLIGPLQTIADVITPPNEDVTNQVTLAFIKAGASDRNNQVEYQFAGPNNSVFDVVVKFTIEKTLLGTIADDNSDLHFTSLNLDTTDTNPDVSVTPELKLGDAIDKLTNKDLHDTLSSLDLGHMPDKVAQPCQTLFSGMISYFPEADAAAEYAATLRKYQKDFRRGAEG